jgi:hypothetical protein
MDGFDEDGLEDGVLIPPLDDEEEDAIDAPEGTLAEEDVEEEDENALPLGMTEVEEEGI